jgi:hypothetical protein
VHPVLQARQDADVTAQGRHVKTEARHFGERHLHCSSGRNTDTNILCPVRSCTCD